MFCNNKKKVKFNNIIYIYLIPSRNDLLKQGLINELWWNINDYNIFFNNYVKINKIFDILIPSISDLSIDNINDKMNDKMNDI